MTPFPSTNVDPPTYDPTLFPGAIRMKVGEVVEVSTGPGSEDAGGVGIDVVTRLADYSNFISYVVDSGT